MQTHTHLVRKLGPAARAAQARRAAGAIARGARGMARHALARHRLVHAVSALPTLAISLKVISAVGKLC